MALTINRKHFLTLTVTFTALGAAAACGDDDDSSNNTGGSGGSGGTAGNGEAGGDTGGSTSGKGGGTTGGNSGSGGTAGGSSGGSSAGTSGSSSGAGAPPGGDNAGGNAGNSPGGNPGVAGAPAENGGAGGAAGGAGGMAGEGGVGGGGPACQGAAIAQTSANGHDHIPNNNPARATFLLDLTNHINGGSATMAFTLPQDGFPAHTHTITLTAGEVETLRSGGTVTGIVSSETNNHTHTYIITCA